MEDDSPKTPVARLFKGFEGYQSPTDADYSSVLSSGLVVLDTNVLLNLYRFTKEARDDLLRVIERLGDSIWVPHQAAHEFFSNREQAILTRDNIHAAAVRDLEKPVLAVHEVVARWMKAVSLPQSRRHEIKTILDEAFGKIGDFIADDRDDSLHGARDTNKDPILARLLGLLDGRIGPAFSQESMSKALKEAERRNQARIPPGYQDKDKADKRSAGDYLVWEQTIVEAERRAVDVLFVTGDIKEDWWRRVQNLPVGPRVELVDEMRDRTGKRLLMSQPQELLRIAGSSLDIAVRPSSVEEIQDSGRVAAGTTSAHEDRIRLYLESALGTGLPAGLVLNLRGANDLPGWDIVIDGPDHQRVLIWFYDPLRPFNDIATDSVSATAATMVEGVRRRFLREKPWLVCVVDLTTLARRMDAERREPWEGNSEKHSALEQAVAKFTPHLHELAAAGFDHVDHVIDTDADNLGRLDVVADKVREHLARPSRP